MSASLSAVSSPVVPGAVAQPGVAAGGQLGGFEALLAALFGTPETGPGLAPGAAATAEPGETVSSSGADAASAQAQSLVAALFIPAAAPPTADAAPAPVAATSSVPAPVTPVTGSPLPAPPAQGAAAGVVPPAPNQPATASPVTPDTLQAQLPSTHTAAQAALAPPPPAAQIVQVATALPVAPSAAAAPPKAPPAPQPEPQAGVPADTASDPQAAMLASAELAPTVPPSGLPEPRAARGAASRRGGDLSQGPAAGSTAATVAGTPANPMVAAPVHALAANGVAALLAAKVTSADGSSPASPEAADAPAAGDLQGPAPAVGDPGSAPIATAHAAVAPAVLVRGAPETVATLAAQILKKLDSRTTRFDMALDPAGLGRVDVRLEVNAHGRVTAAMAFDNPHAAAELRGRANELTRMLEQAGFDVTGGLSFDVAGDRSQSGQNNAARDQNDTSTWRGRAFQAALDGAADADLAAGGALQVRRQLLAGVDIKI